MGSTLMGSTPTSMIPGPSIGPLTPELPGRFSSSEMGFVLIECVIVMTFISLMFYCESVSLCDAHNASGD